MGLETDITDIQSLNQNWPPVSDPRAQGADHIRNIKKAIQLTFPNLKQCLLNDAQFTALGTLIGDGSGTFTINGKLTVSDTLTVKGTLLVPTVTDWTTQQAVGAKDADGRYLKPGDADGRYLKPGDADGRYVRSPLTSGVDNRVTFIGTNKTTGQPYVSLDDGSLIWLQPEGDYATHTDVANVINNNIVIAQQMHVDTSGYLQLYRQSNVATDGILDLYSNWSSPNNNVARIDSQGNIYTFSGGALYLDDPHANSGNSGDWNRSPGIQFGLSGRNANARMWCEEHVGTTTQVTLQINGLGNNTFFWFDGPSGRLNTSMGNMAFTSDLPFLDQNLRWSVVRELVTKDGSGHSTHTFPVAFAAGTQPFVLPVGSREVNTTYSSIPMISLDSNGNPLISNTGMTLYWTTGNSDSVTKGWLTYLVGGYL